MSDSKDNRTEKSHKKNVIKSQITSEFKKQSDQNQSKINSQNCIFIKETACQTRNKIKNSLKFQQDSSPQSRQNFNLAIDLISDASLIQNFQDKTKQMSKQQQTQESEVESIKFEEKYTPNFHSKSDTLVLSPRLESSFMITTITKKNGVIYELNQSFRLFDRKKASQKIFMASPCNQTPIKERFNIVIQLRLYEEGDDRNDSCQIILNSQHIPEMLQSQIADAQKFFWYLFKHQNSIEFCIQNTNLSGINYIRLRNQNQKRVIFIPLYYPKDQLKSQSLKRIGFIEFSQDIPNNLLAKICQNLPIRKILYSKTLRIQNQCTGFSSLYPQHQQHNKIITRAIGYASNLTAKVLRLKRKSYKCINNHLLLTGLKILFIEDLESLQCLQMIEFNCLQAIVIGGTDEVNLRSLRKLAIFPQKDKKFGLYPHQALYPRYIQIRKRSTVNEFWEYTFTNLSYLTELSFQANINQSIHQKHADLVVRDVPLLPFFVFAKMNAILHNSFITEALYKEPSLYPIISRRDQCLSKELCFLLDEQK